MPELSSVFCAVQQVTFYDMRLGEVSGLSNNGSAQVFGDVEVPLRESLSAAADWVERHPIVSIVTMFMAVLTSIVISGNVISAFEEEPEILTVQQTPIIVTPTPIPTATVPPPSPTPEPTADPRDAYREYEADGELVSAISAGLETVDGQRASLRNAYWQRSEEHNKVYFVAATIIRGGHTRGIGVWATNGLDGRGSIFSVNGTASRNSQWGRHPETNMNDQARDAVEIVETIEDLR